MQVSNRRIVIVSLILLGIIHFIIFVNRIMYYSNTRFLEREQCLYIGDKLENYRLVDCLYSKALLTSIERNEGGSFYVIFSQEYNHNMYNFKFLINKESKIPVYFCIKPRKFSEKRCFLIVNDISDNSITIKLKTEDIQPSVAGGA